MFKKKETAPANEIKPTVNFTPEMIASAIKESKDPREVAYSMLVNYLYDRQKLKMISRLDGEMMKYIVKNLIVIDFYQRWWSDAKADISFVKTKTPPYYEKKVKYTWPVYDGKKDPRYENLINDILELTISLEHGKGRQEILEIIKSAENELNLAERLKGAMKI